MQADMIHYWIYIHNFVAVVTIIRLKHQIRTCQLPVHFAVIRHIYRQIRVAHLVPISVTLEIVTEQGM